MKTLTVPAQYGYQELRQYYKRFMLVAMGFSIFMQIMIISGYYLLQENQVDPLPLEGTVIDITKLLPPPLNPPIGLPAVPLVPTKLADGIPVPVPDFQVNPEINYAGQGDLAQKADQDWATIEKAGDNVTISIEEKDPSPTEFPAIEKLPEMVTRVVPDYPDLAQRGCLEGTVWVKMLVAKDGKIKKVLIAKSDSEIFEEPAKEAAMKWVFTPGIMNGKPVAVWVTVPFRFRLTGK